MLQKLFSTFRTNLISGALALIPLVAVVWIVAWLWGLVEGFRDFFPMGLDPRVFFGIQDVIALALLNWLITIVVLVAIVLFVAIVGLVSRNILGRRILAVVHHFVNRIPVLSAVYSTLEQLLDTFASNKGKSFRRVVLVEFPRTGIWTIGLVTGDRDHSPIADSNEKFINVFIPNTPLPTNGFFLMVPESQVRPSDLTVEEALKQVISMGMLQ